MKPLEEYYKSPAMAELMSLYGRYGKQRGERLGQFFMNNYIRGAWNYLYYQENEETSKLMIVQWLQRYHYYSTLPKPFKDLEEVYNGN